MDGLSYYKEILQDEKATYFTKEFFDIENDGTKDVSKELQKAIYAYQNRDRRFGGLK